MWQECRHKQQRGFCVDCLRQAVIRASEIEHSVTQGQERELRQGYRELLTGTLEADHPRDDTLLIVLRRSEADQFWFGFSEAVEVLEKAGIDTAALGRLVDLLKPEDEATSARNV